MEPGPQHQGGPGLGLNQGEGSGGLCLPARPRPQLFIVLGCGQVREGPSTPPPPDHLSVLRGWAARSDEGGHLLSHPLSLSLWSLSPSLSVSLSLSPTSPSGSDSWTAAERRCFNKGIAAYKKDFFMVQKLVCVHVTPGFLVSTQLDTSYVARGL